MEKYTIEGCNQAVKLKRSQDILSLHDAELSSSQQAKKALMCLPTSSAVSVAAAKSQQNNLLLAQQQAQLKQLYAQYPIFDPSFTAATTAYDNCPLMLQPTLQQLQLAQAHSMEPTAQTEPSNEIRIDTSKHFHVFVGDLSKDVSNEMLKSSFEKFGEVSEAKVIRDAQTQKSKGYGFVSFPDKNHAEAAINGMNGKWIGKRAVRTNWAARKNTEETRDKLTFEQVFNSTKPENTSVYIGNVTANVSDTELREAFSVFGEIAEVRVFKAQKYAFVRFEKKECATKAIMDMNGKEVCGVNIRCSWGRTHPQAQAVPTLPLDLTSLMTLPTLMSTASLPLIQNPYLSYEPTAFLYNTLQQW
ncbi:unnamed protein product [Caenorhabditis angaria]|uniref:RRM domain-containing protein n=1 Tax=Caenorhabditis angaria TaxID=860376 RepID=A0A9P1N966_9PELO|nr:unnamed protein product [Caenorhabditis angaria]